MKKGYLVLLVCLFCIPLFAHAQSGSDVIVFADPVLETKICKAIGKTNGPITYAEAEEVTELNLGNETKDDESQLITDLSGMENFPNIFNLSAYNNNISDVTPLSKIAGLKYLDLGGNSISDLSPFEGHYFEALNLWGNNINDVTPMLNITVNQRLYLNDNIISDVCGLTSQTKLQTLILGNNFITDFSPIADMCKNIEEIDFDPSTPQVSFTLDDYSVINEEIYFPDPMFEACVRKFFGFPDDMAITVKDVCFSGFLKADDSQEVPEDQKITDITGIEYFYSLEGLQIYNHSISDITPLANLNKLTYIDLGGNHISDISALAGHYMNSVSLWGNNITDISPITSITGLTELYLAGNPIEDYSPIADIYDTLTNKDFEYIALREAEDPDAVITFTDSVFESLVRIVMNKPEGDITQGDAAAVTELDLQMNPSDWSTPRISDLSDIAYFINLQKLNLGWALDYADGAAFDISPLANLTSLKDLSLHGDNIDDISALSGLTNLQWLWLFGNRITDITPLANLTKLFDLWLHSNQISDISVLSGMPELWRLTLNQNLITNVTPLSGLTKLESLSLADNQIADYTPLTAIYPNLTETDFNLDDTYTPTKEDLKKLDTAFNDLLMYPDNPDNVIRFADPVFEQKVRESIGISGGDITERDAALVTELWLGNEWQDVFPEGSQITSVDGIQYFLNLKRLELTFNKITDISALAGLTQLDYMKLFGNEIVDISPLAGLVNLTCLNIGSNEITDISALENLTKLTSLHLSENAITDFSPIEDIYPNLTDKDFDLP